MGRADADERYRLLVERSPYCIHEIGLDACLTSMNRAGLEMMAIDEESEIVGLPYMDVVGDADRPRIEDLLRRALRGEASTFEFEGSNKHIYSSTFVPITDDQDNVIRLMGLTQDVTEQRQLEAQVRQAQKLESVGELAGGLAHDFNNILLVILGELDIARTRLTEGKSPTDSLDAIGRAATRASDLTERLLTVGRRRPLHLVPTDLANLLDAQSRDIARILPESIEVTFRSEPDLPAVKIDASQIEQVVLNLCVNAGHSMPHGGSLEIATRLVAPDAGHAEPAVGIYLTDTGSGMTPAVRERAFEPFFTTKPIGLGNGLGLAVVHGIVNQHGGSVSLRSEVDRGTCVSIELPVSDEPLRREQPRMEPARETATGTILVAEDDDQVRSLVRAMVEHVGYTVIEAEDGECAVQELAAHPEIDLALLDVVMPRMNGAEVCDVILAEYPHVRVLFTSGYSSDMLPPGYLEKLGIALLQKPYQAVELFEAIRAALKR